jgi:hypothetical protein
MIIDKTYNIKTELEKKVFMNVINLIKLGSLGRETC